VRRLRDRRDDQAIAALGQGLDELRVAGVIVQRMADLTDRMVKRFLAALALTPDRVDE
jgi:hypothetical protein